MAMAGWTCLTYASQPTFWQITVYAWSVTITTGLLLLIPEDRVLKARRAVAAGRWRVPRCGVHSLGRWGLHQVAPMAFGTGLCRWRAEQALICCSGED
jgi:hypothetical protein